MTSLGGDTPHLTPGWREGRKTTVLFLQWLFPWGSRAGREERPWNGKKQLEVREVLGVAENLEMAARASNAKSPLLRQQPLAAD